MQLLVGQVSVRSKTKLHYAVYGRAYCGAGNGTILGPARQLVADAIGILCRRCVKAVRAAVQEAIHVVMRRRDSLALRVLNRLADALRTPAEIKAEEATLAEIATAIRTSPSGRRPRNFGEFRLMHMAAVERDRVERHGQLELCKVAG
jgi:hypothetical protein